MPTPCITYDTGESHQKIFMTTLTKHIARAQSKCAVTAWAIGLLAGLIQGFYGDSALPLVVTSLLGSAFVGISGACGTMTGLVVRVVIAESRKQKSLWESEEIISALVLGTLCGSFLGLVLFLVLGLWHLAGIGSIAGSFLGALLCTLQSRRSDMLIQLLTVEKQPDMEFDDYQKRQQLPPPDDD